ncbi:hemolysin family protein [Burkholderia sp. Tr-860]|uniref:hemolysin family protein n=1 Tax=Burkholderia sp. Tr-860 TaxID=2608338 RepID=UPI001F0355CB|nr:hemolysin family protein [Burkholderia sp. Tr-860]
MVFVLKDIAAEFNTKIPAVAFAVTLTLARQHGLRGRILRIVHARLDAYLSACQLGITLASLGLGWIGEPAFAEILSPLLDALGIESPQLVHAISLVFAFSVISFLHIVVGELAPKSMAIRQPEQVGLWLALPLYAFYWMMYPAIWVLNSSANAVLRIVGLSAEHGGDSHYSTDELKLILRSRRNAAGAKAPVATYSNDEWNTLAHSLDFSSMTVSDLMRPANEMIGLRRDLPLPDNMEVVARHRFSRYPLFTDASREQVTGLIHLKDLLLARHAGAALEDLSDYVRPVQYVRPDTPALELFRRFRKGAPHFALVGNKHEKPIGFLTLDNLLGALVGQIHDEFRQGDADWARLDDGTLMGKGSLPVVSLEQALGIDIDEGRAESVGGLVIQALSDLPTEGQRVSFDSFDVVVKKMNGPRIVLVRVYPKALKEADE